jgi:hypothetical protein
MAAPPASGGTQQQHQQQDASAAAVPFRPSERARWSTEMRKLFCPPAMLTPDGAIDQEYFRPRGDVAPPGAHGTRLGQQQATQQPQEGQQQDEREGGDGAAVG